MLLNSLQIPFASQCGLQKSTGGSHHLSEEIKGWEPSWHSVALVLFKRTLVLQKQAETSAKEEKPLALKDPSRLETLRAQKTPVGTLLPKPPLEKCPALASYGWHWRVELW